MIEAIELVAPSSTPRRWLFALCVLLPGAITAAALAWQAGSGASQSMAGASTSTSSLTALAGVVVFTVGLWVLLDRAMQRHRLHLDGERMQVRTSFYSIDLAVSELKLEAARVVDLDERTELKPLLKTNGYALPGFKSGHFRLGSGDKAFVAIAGERRALWLPTTRGKVLLLQPRQPEALLAGLRELAKATSRR